MFHSAILILSGNAATSLLLLTRNLIVARLIPAADYGIAATFAIAMTMVEMMSALGLQQQIIQAKNGEDPRFQAALQGFQVLRGVLAGAVLFALAGSIADFLNVPEAAWAYRVMALVPVLNALTHFDTYRLTRTMVFWPMLLTGGVPALVSVLAVWPLAMFYGDYRVMLWAIIVQAVLTAGVSHLVARRPYRLVLDSAIMAGSLRFGWAILLNGILMFAAFQGDKVIVGREIGMVVLAVFAMGSTLTLTPTLVMAKSANNFFLPQLSAVDQDDSEGQRQFAHLTIITMQAHMLFGTFLVIAMIIAGPTMVHIVLGENFAEMIPILPLMAIMQALRLSKDGSSAVVLSRGRAVLTLFTYIPRVLSLPLAWWVAITTGEITDIIWVAICAEAVGLAIALLLVTWNIGVCLRPLVWPLASSIALLITAAMYTSGDLALGAYHPFWGIFLVVTLWIASIVTMRDLRIYVVTMTKRVRIE